MSNVLVVPSNRPELLADFVEAWSPVSDWDRMIIVFDGPSHDEARHAVEQRETSRPIHWYCWADIDRELGDDAWIISRKSSAVRTFGFLKARDYGADVIVTIDDDCMPTEDRLFATHLDAMNNTPQWVDSAIGMTARGMPYRNRGQLDGIAMNVGLWRIVGDWDSPHSLVGDEDQKHFEPQTDQRVIPSGQYVPVSSMNLAFRASALPLLYFPKMGQDVPHDRFEDIWCGIIAKRVFDHLGWHVSVGRPVVNHQRASNPFVNLQKEATGIASNETFWERIADIRLSGQTASACMAEISESLCMWPEEYFQTLGKAIKIWIRHTSGT